MDVKEFVASALGGFSKLLLFLLIQGKFSHVWIFIFLMFVVFE